MQLQIFKYAEDEDHLRNLTTIEIDGEAWFIASEVCELLGIKNSPDKVSKLDDDEKNTIVISDGTPGNPTKTIISESGLYSLIFTSTKPFAKTFRRWVTREVIPTIRKTGAYGINRLALPNFVVRFNDNWDRTDRGYFSVISELFVRLYGRFEQVGYQIPDKAFNGKEIRPDVSVGRGFSAYLTAHYPEIADEYKYYPHVFRQRGLEVDARQYKNELLPIFIKYLDEDWIINNSEKYFRDRDQKALDYLPKLLKGNSKGKAA